MNSFCNSILKKINKKNDLNIDKLQRKIYNLTQKKWGIKLNLGWGIKLNLDKCYRGEKEQFRLCIYSGRLCNIIHKLFMQLNGSQCVEFTVFKEFALKDFNFFLFIGTKCHETINRHGSVTI